jgi:class 3 adenylate cyclase
MPSILDRLYRRLGAGYFWLYLGFEVVSAMVVCLATVGMFSLYTDDIAAVELVAVVAFTQLCVLIAVAYTMAKASVLMRPVIDWLRRGRTNDGAREAWLAAVALPRDFATRNGWQPFLIVGFPTSVFATVLFGLPAYSALIIFAGALVAVAYVGVLHFFVSEQFMRPVIADLAEHLPHDFGDVRAGVPLRWKLLGALPIVNVITGVVVSGLSTDGTASLEDLGLDVVVAVLVAFTLSLELTVLITKSVLRPVYDLLDATKAVARGDLEVRVPVTSGDELGELAVSFNAMMRGLSEREALRDALGSYVDPGVAERVLREGELLEAEEREVTVMFVDVRGFTPMAERLSARETVAFLSSFFDAVVPVVLAHGGHANKFLGDGLLAVFGAPQRLTDHADRAVSCAREIASEVARRFSGDVRVGIGINSGPVVVGSVGGGGRLEFSVIGDAVNISARAERVTRDTGDVVLVTQATRALLTQGREELVPRGEMELKGITAPVSLYGVPTAVDERPSSPAPPLVADV